MKNKKTKTNIFFIFSFIFLFFNKLVPGDKSALVPSGVRMGTPALTSRGYDEKDFVQVAEYFDEAVKIASSIKDSTFFSKICVHYTSCNYRKNYFYLSISKS